MADYRDICIDELAMSEALLVRRVADLKAEVASYRAVAVAGIHHAHDLRLEGIRLRRQVEHLRGELRRVHAQVIPNNNLAAKAGA